MLYGSGRCPGRPLASDFFFICDSMLFSSEIEQVFDKLVAILLFFSVAGGQYLIDLELHHLPDGHPRHYPANNPATSWFVDLTATSLVNRSACPGCPPRRPHSTTIRLIGVFHSAPLRSRQMITFASLRPAPCGRVHLGSPLPYAPDLTDTFAVDRIPKAFRKDWLSAT